MTREERDKAIRILQWLHDNNFLFRSTEEDVKFATEYAIKALEQDPKTGHWVRWYEQKEHDLYTENIPHCKCSECGKEYDAHSSLFINYCNKCGARMVEPKESEE